MKKLIVSLVICLGLLAFSLPVFAQIINPNVAGDFTAQMKPSTGYTDMTVGGIIAVIIRAALGLLAVIFLVLMIVAGFGWMTAGGDEKKVKKSQDTIKTAIIGLLIVLAAYAITYFIFSVLPFSVGPGGAQGGTSG